MAYPSTARHSILPASQASQTTQPTQATALQSRIAAKRLELANLSQLRTLSSQMAAQMVALEAKLATLRDGTEAVACILANWENVLKAISMASTRAAAVDLGHERGNDGREGDGEGQGEGGLPVTLVRIPVKNDGAEEGEG